MTDLFLSGFHVFNPIFLLRPKVGFVAQSRIPDMKYCPRFSHLPDIPNILVSRIFHCQQLSVFVGMKMLYPLYFRITIAKSMMELIGRWLCCYRRLWHSVYTKSSNSIFPSSCYHRLICPHTNWSNKQPFNNGVSTASETLGPRDSPINTVGKNSLPNKGLEFQIWPGKSPDFSPYAVFSASKRHKRPQLKTWSSSGPNCWNDPHLVLISHKRLHFPHYDYNALQPCPRY